MYLTASRPDIVFAIGVCARYQADPKASHLTTTKQILRYLKGSKSLGLWYPTGNEFSLQAFTDADHAGCKLDRKSTSGGCQFLGERLVSWSSRKQSCVSLSTTEADSSLQSFLGSSAMTTLNRKAFSSAMKILNRNAFSSMTKILNRNAFSSAMKILNRNDVSIRDHHDNFPTVSSTLEYLCAI
ncbi:hypothetical protein Lser_V15G40438 [Lactuca serriola]